MKASTGIRAICWLFRSLNTSKISYITMLLLISIVEAAMPIVAAFVYIDIFNATLTEDYDLLLRGSLLFAASLLVAITLLPVTKFRFSVIVKGVMKDLRQDVYDRIIRTGPSEIDFKHSGDILTRSTDDLNRIEEIFANHFRVIAQALVYCLGSIITMLVLEWRFSIALVMLCIFSSYIIMKNSESASSVGRVIQQKLGELTQRFIDTYSGLQVIKLYSMQNKVIEKNKAENKQYSDAIVKQGIIFGRLDSWTYVLNFLNYTGVIAIGILLILVGQMELGILIAFAQLQWNMSQSFLQLGNTFVSLNTSFVSYERLTGILNFQREEPAPVSTEQNALPMSLCDISYHIADIQVLSDIHLDLAPDKRIAVVGESGSGKSTLIKILAGLYTPTGGGITSNGNMYGLNHLVLYRSESAYLSQEPFIFKGTVYDNILYGNCGADRDQVERAAKLALAHDFIMSLSLGYETVISEQGKDLSGGQRQRIALSRLFLKNSALMLFDEATSALDPESEEKIQQAIRQVSSGKCIIQSTHLIEAITDYDEILVLHGGQIVERGTHQQLMEQGGKYRSMVESKFHKGDEYEQNINLATL